MQIGLVLSMLPQGCMIRVIAAFSYVTEHDWPVRDSLVPGNHDLTVLKSGLG